MISQSIPGVNRLGTGPLNFRFTLPNYKSVALSPTLLYTGIINRKETTL